MEEVGSVEECFHHSFFVLRWIVRRKIKIFVGMGCFSVNINLYGAITQHGYSRVQKGNTQLLVSLACALYCELDVSVNASDAGGKVLRLFSLNIRWSRPHTSATSEAQLER